MLNGVQWTSVFGYRASYVTAHNNGDYGIYAFDSQYGQFDHSYAGGSPDSGFYIGQCDPCHAVITDSLGGAQRDGLLGDERRGRPGDREQRVARQHGGDRAEHAGLRGEPAAARRADRRELRARQQLDDRGYEGPGIPDVRRGDLDRRRRREPGRRQPGRGSSDVRHRADTEPGREPLGDARQRGARQPRPPERPGGPGARRAVGRWRLLLGQPVLDERTAAHRDVVRLRRAVAERGSAGAISRPRSTPASASSTPSTASSRTGTGGPSRRRDRNARWRTR